MDRKMRELLALKQGADTVYQYAQKFNSLCQYGGHHVDTVAKKMERFRDGLDGDLYERLIRLEPNSYHELVLTVKIRQPSHEFTFGVGITFVSNSLVLTPVV
jgi:hypothetical protein